MIVFLEQQSLKTKTRVYLFAFVALTLLTAFFIEFFLRGLDEGYDPPVPIVGLLFLTVTSLVALFNYSMYRNYGGDYVAESMGAKRVDDSTKDPNERILLNIVEEMTLASSMPRPSVYLIPSKQINAFAAGLKSDKSCVAVTQGALQKLSRDELQGVVAHEFGHIANGDMALSLRLAAMIMGFYFVLYLGLRALQVSAMSRSRQKGSNPVLLAALALIIAGVFTWILGSILKSLVSRNREYLADASAVQYTRNPQGIAGALIKIRDEVNKPHDMPKTGTAYAHMYFDHASFGGFFATHPPINKRIEKILGKNSDSSD